MKEALPRARSTTGPKTLRSTALTGKMKPSSLLFDDYLYALQVTMRFGRHGISRLPEVEGDKPKMQEFERYPIGPCDGRDGW
jgi:hypothetical protein